MGNGVYWGEITHFLTICTNFQGFITSHPLILTSNGTSFRREGRSSHPGEQRPFKLHDCLVTKIVTKMKVERLGFLGLNKLQSWSHKSWNPRISDACWVNEVNLTYFWWKDEGLEFCYAKKKCTNQNKCDPVGGLNPSERYARRVGNLPQIGVKTNYMYIWNHVSHHLYDNPTRANERGMLTKCIGPTIHWGELHKRNCAWPTNLVA